MSDLKAGDEVVCVRGDGTHLKTGETYKVSGHGIGDLVKINIGIVEVFSDRLNLVLKPKFKVGDRVYYITGPEGEKKPGTVCKMPEEKIGLSFFSGSEVWANWDHSGIGWMPSDRVLADKTRGQIIGELRKAAGLPRFVVGDVVKVLNDKAPAGNYKGIPVGTETTIRSLGVYNESGWILEGSPSYVFTEDQIELVAPAGEEKPEARSTVRTFEVDQWVRVIDSDQVGQVTEDDGDDETCWPYTVEFLDGDTDLFDAADLVPWIPHAGERIQIVSGLRNPDHGTVKSINRHQEVITTWDDGNGNFAWFDISEMAPSEKPAPAPRKRLKKGDRVRYLGNSFMLNMPTGELATLYEDQEGSTIRIKWDTRGAALDGGYNAACFELTTSPAVVETTLKRGDVVEVINNRPYRDGTKAGDLGIVTDKGSLFLHHSKDGIIPQIFNERMARETLKLAA